MKKRKDPFESIFDSLHNKTQPTTEQKEKMLNYVLTEGIKQNNSLWVKAGRWITVYPWRFAFSAAAAQAVVCTALFGTGYTNLFLSLFGG